MIAHASAAEALDGAITAIAAAGCETPRLDAELLLAHALGISREQLLTASDGGGEAGITRGSEIARRRDGSTVAGPAVRAFQAAVRRRSAEREPVAYIVGTRAFRRLQLAVDRRALIPRPETELLVEAGLSLRPGSRVLDVGTGSGAVALALKDERPDLLVSASEISAPALQLARENAARLGLDVGLLQADLLGGVPDKFDAVLANLPYVAARERASLAPEIVRHEPPLALFAGPDGLRAIRGLLAQLAGRRAVSFCALEVGATQAGAVAELTREAGFERVRCLRDLAGIERVVIGEGRR